MVGLLAEKIKQPLGRQPIYEDADLFFCVRVPQGGQQPGDGVRVLGGGVRGGPARGILVGGVQGVQTPDQEGCSRGV